MYFALLDFTTSGLEGGKHVRRLEILKIGFF